MLFCFDLLLDSMVTFDVRLVLLILHLSFHVLTVLTLFQFFLLSLLLSDLALFFRGRCLLLCLISWWFVWRSIGGFDEALVVIFCWIMFVV